MELMKERLMEDFIKEEDIQEDLEVCAREVAQRENNPYRASEELLKKVITKEAKNYENH